MSRGPYNYRPGLDAGWAVLFAPQRPRPRDTQAERYCDTRLCCANADAVVVRFRRMFRHPILGRPAEAALLPRWEALLTMDRRRSCERRENDRKEVLPLGTSTWTRARIRAEWLISTEPLHRR